MDIAGLYNAVRATVKGEPTRLHLATASAHAAFSHWQTHPEEADNTIRNLRKRPQVNPGPLGEWV